MKRANYPITLLVGACSVLLSTAPFARAADAPQADSATPPTTAAPTAAAPAKLPYGVEDVVKLSRAQISEDIVLNYVKNSGTIYNLAPADIVVLRNEGVSDRVINAILDQRKNVADASAQAQQAPAPTAPTTAPAPAVQPDYQAAAQPAPVYVEAPQPASSVYVIPYPAATTAYYGSYGYYGGYYGGYYPYYYGPYYRPYCGPRVSVGFRYGGGPRHYHRHW